MTAWVTGTATDYDDLLDDLKTFLTTNASLTGASPSQAWTVLKDTTTDVVGERHLYLRGPGLANTDQIHVNIRRYSKPTLSPPAYNWELSGATAYDGNVAFGDQPGISTRDAGNEVSPIFCLDNNTIQYWFIANGRRFIVIANLGSAWTSCYCGFLLPYATPTEYPYPLFIGGSTNEWENAFNQTVGSEIRGFFSPQRQSCYFRDVSGSWRSVGNFSGTSLQGAITDLRTLLRR